MFCQYFDNSRKNEGQAISDTFALALNESGIEPVSPDSLRLALTTTVPATNPAVGVVGRPVTVNSEQHRPAYEGRAGHYL